MKNINLSNAIWRSRAMTIMGFLIITLAILPGLPGPLETTLFVILGLLTLAFGLAGSRHESYVKLETNLNKDVGEAIENEQIFPVVETDTQMPMAVTEEEDKTQEII